MSVDGPVKWRDLIHVKGQPFYKAMFFAQREDTHTGSPSRSLEQFPQYKNKPCRWFGNGNSTVSPAAAAAAAAEAAPPATEAAAAAADAADVPVQTQVDHNDIIP